MDGCLIKFVSLDTTLPACQTRCRALAQQSVSPEKSMGLSSPLLYCHHIYVLIYIFVLSPTSFISAPL